MSFLPVLLALAGASGGSTEMRGVWVVRTGLTSPQSIDAVVDEARRGGFNTLFVQVRGRGDAFYRSRLVPRSDLLSGQPPAFDPLARLLHRARERGLQVHAWVNVLLTANFGQRLPPDHVLAQHPEWAMVTQRRAARALAAAPGQLPDLWREARGEGDAEGVYLSPAVPGVPAHLEQVVSELLLAYPVDGLHLDFVRYPGPDYDYSRAALAGFAAARTSLGPGALDLLAASSSFPERWAEYRRARLDGLVERLARAARTARPRALISAAVVPDEAQAVHHRFQRWPPWVRHGWVDAVCPMAYTPETALFRSQIGHARTLLGRSAMWAGIGAYRLGVEGVIEKIRAARETGADGVVLFSHESLMGADLDRLRDEGFADDSPRRAVGGAASRR